MTAQAIVSPSSIHTFAPIISPTEMSARTLATERMGVVLDLFDPEDAAVRDYVSQLWAEDWDSPEDEIYDTW